MKQTLLLVAVCITSFLSAQSEDYDKLQNQIDANKTKIETLQSSVNAVTTENIYLKKVLDIQKPIKEASVENSTYKVVSVKGDRKSKNILIEILVESSDRNKYFINTKANMVDVLGNHYPLEIFLSKSHCSMQYKNVPLKMTFGFYNVADEPKFIKIFTLESLVQFEGEEYNSKNKIAIEFRDLPVDWK